MLAQGLLDRTEERRQIAGASLDPARRDALGQIFTPSVVAEFLASLFDLPRRGSFTLLDPGAGIGSLSAAVVARVARETPGLNLHLVCFELDEELIPYLDATLQDCHDVGAQFGLSVTTHVRQADFLMWASAVASGDAARDVPPLTACVMNPPYRKIGSGDAERLALERVGLRVTNLYPAFLALAASLLEPGGQLTAITPRSFANGTYFRPFREFFLSRMSLSRLHTYARRGYVFADSDVLQENIVLRATRSVKRETVVLSVSSGRSNDAITLREVPYEDVVKAGDPELFVHIPVEVSDTHISAQVAALPATLFDLGVSVSTGRVVDFRVKDHLRMSPEDGTAPLIYPEHLRNSEIAWPKLTSKKPNSLASNRLTDRLLLPNETYVLVKRFTAKEERRRVVAALSSAEQLPGERVGFENHLNVFHVDNRGLDDLLARGLVLFLNSSLIDAYVRQFSGHTQINAGDLRRLRYPSLVELRSLGTVVGLRAWPESQQAVDRLVTEHVAAFESDAQDTFVEVYRPRKDAARRISQAFEPETPVETVINGRP